MDRRRNIFLDTFRIPYEFTSAEHLCNNVKNNVNFVQRLALEKRLDAHTGCVNTICWNDSGQLLLSGSDDRKLVITDPYSQKMLVSYRTGHRANIFSAKFIPNTRDKQVVSCSGDGLIYHSFLEREESNSFDCHSGTAYEILTVPQDPHSFLSCGEDGTVRWFDLRIKGSCNKESCKEDVLINCRRAVTAIATNPRAAYQLAVGCSDSSVRIYDRRMLGTKATGNYTGRAVLGIMSRFCAPGLEEEYHRITSLTFSNDGCEILVSYSSENIYLFNLEDSERAKEFSLNESATDGDSKNGDRHRPIKRLRLRGDWSDTGPSARPQRERGDEQSQVDRAASTLSDMLTRWLEGLSRRGNNQDPSSAASSSSGNEVNESPNNGSEGNEVTATRPEASANDAIENRVTDAAPANQATVNEVTAETANQGSCCKEPSPGPSGLVKVDKQLEHNDLTSSSQDQKLTAAQSDTLDPAQLLTADSSQRSPEGQMHPAVQSQLDSSKQLSHPSQAQPVSCPDKPTPCDTPDTDLTHTDGANRPQGQGQTFDSPRVDDSGIVIGRHSIEPLVSLHYSHQSTCSGTIQIDCRIKERSDAASLSSGQGHLSNGQGHTSSGQVHKSSGQGHTNSGQGQTSSGQGHEKSDQGQTSSDQGHTNRDQGQTSSDQGHTNSDQGLTCSDQGHSEALVQGFSKMEAEVDSQIGTCDSDLRQGQTSTENTQAERSKTISTRLAGTDVSKSSTNQQSAPSEPIEEGTDSLMIGSSVTIPDRDLDDVSMTSEPHTETAEPSVQTHLEPLSSNLLPSTSDLQSVTSDLQAVSSNLQAVTSDPPYVTSELRALSPELQPAVSGNQASSSDLQVVTPDLEASTSDQQPVTSDPQPVTSDHKAVTPDLQSVTSDLQPCDPGEGVSGVGAARSDRQRRIGISGTPTGPCSSPEGSDDEESDPEHPAVPKRQGSGREHPSWERNAAARKLQELYRKRQDAREREECSMMQLPEPKMTRVYAGHRNSRTMIKESTFWGEDYVMSGSDCGHIFIWDKYTAKLVMLLEGDKHVVNCLQPHPYDPILATSGIDYDIKIWTPSALEPGYDQIRAKEILARNKVMLEETRDTITVPSSFMLRMLASLNHFRAAHDPQVSNDELSSPSSDED